MFESLSKLFFEFNHKEKRNFWMVLLIVLASSLIQVIGVASIMPFIALVAEPQLLESNKWLLLFKSSLNLNSAKDVLLALGMVVFSILVLTNSLMALTSWSIGRFSIGLTHDLSVKMLTCYLNEKYLFHLHRNSAELLQNLTNEVYRAINGGVMNGILFLSKVLSAGFIIALLIYVDPFVAFIMGLLLGGSYVVIFLLVKKRLGEEARSLSKAYSERNRIINESLGGIKELKLLGREYNYLKRFRKVSDDLIKYQVFSKLTAELPKYLMETVAIGGILAATIYLISIKENMSTVLPVISLYALAGYRLMPALQGIFQSATALKSNLASIDSFYEDIKGQASVLNLIDEPEDPNLYTEPMQFREGLVLQSVFFKYPNTSNWAISDISLNFRANTTIGVVGESGSGKSTLVDLILGLIEPDKGAVCIDGIALNAKNKKNWQSNVGYVPQFIYLTDSSIAENIAFGLNENGINVAEVVRSAKMAGLHEFIINNLEEGYETVVGERGVRLSGGQRQRIGIARALYHNPNVIILDEATSALDTPTESAVMKEVYSLSKKKTIIMIAHRISTIKLCDNIIVMDKGKVASQGRFDDLIDTCEIFKRLALTHKRQ
jgi:ATP-binding cassette, subfamily B, bacterial PglK